jgi:hypothetical protein
MSVSRDLSPRAVLGVLAVTPGHHPLGKVAGLISVVLVMITVTVGGAAVGIMTRSPSRSITIVAAAVPIPDAAGGLLGRIQPWVVGACPGTVVSQIVGGAHRRPSHRPQTEQQGRPVGHGPCVPGGPGAVPTGDRGHGREPAHPHEVRDVLEPDRRLLTGVITRSVPRTTTDDGRPAVDQPE